MSRAASGVRPLTWRRRACKGEYRHHGTDVPLVAEASGKVTEESSTSTELDIAQRCLLSAVVNLNNRRTVLSITSFRVYWLFYDGRRRRTLASD